MPSDAALPSAESTETILLEILRFTLFVISMGNLMSIAGCCQSHLGPLQLRSGPKLVASLRQSSLPWHHSSTVIDGECVRFRPRGSVMPLQAVLFGDFAAAPGSLLFAIRALLSWTSSLVKA